MEEVKFIVEETSTGFSAYAEDLPVYTTGGSMEELKANIEEAMDLYQEETGDGVRLIVVASRRPIF